MKKPLLKIAEAVLTIIASLFLIIRYLWLKFSVNVLKRMFDVETPTYRKWHQRRVDRIQKALDKEHGLAFANVKS